MLKASVLALLTG